MGVEGLFCTEAIHPHPNPPPARGGNEITRTLYLPLLSIFYFPLTMTTQFDNVSVIKKSNIYFDGKCVSHTVIFADGTRKTVGVIFPSTLSFNTGAPEIMEVIDGKCRVQQAGSSDWQTYGAGQSFNVPGNSSFQIETVETVDYVCHFA